MGVRFLDVQGALARLVKTQDSNTATLTGSFTPLVFTGTISRFQDNQTAVITATAQANINRTATFANATQSSQTSVITGQFVAPALPFAPTGLIVTPLSSTSILLDWADNNPNGLINYKVYRSNDGTTWGAALTTITGSPPLSTYTDSTLSAGQTRYYRVTASNSFGESAPSTAQSGTTTGSWTVPSSFTGTIGVPQDFDLSAAIAAAIPSGHTYVAIAMSAGSVLPAGWTLEA